MYTGGVQEGYRFFNPETATALSIVSGLVCKKRGSVCVCVCVQNFVLKPNFAHTLCKIPCIYISSDEFFITKTRISDVWVKISQKVASKSPH